VQLPPARRPRRCRRRLPLLFPELRFLVPELLHLHWRLNAAVAVRENAARRDSGTEEGAAKHQAAATGSTALSSSLPPQGQLTGIFMITGIVDNAINALEEVQH